MLCYDGKFHPQGYRAAEKVKKTQEQRNGADKRIRAKRIIEWLRQNITDGALSSAPNLKEFQVAQELIKCYHFPQLPLPAPMKLRSSMAIEHATGPFKPHFSRFYKKSDEAVQVYRFSAPDMAVHGGQIMSVLSGACQALERFQGSAHTFADQAQVMIKGLRKTCPINDDTPLNYFTATTHAADIPDDLLFEMFDNRNRGKQAASSNAKPPKP